MGEVIVVIGPNGAGKSTLMNILAGAIEPTEGILRLAGGPPTKRFKDVQQYLGVCFQENVLISVLTIREHFQLFGSFRNLQDDEISGSLMSFAETLQLTEMLDNRAGDLSGGQKRKLCVALSLLGNPRIVIMDEPTAGVDVQARQLIWKTIATLQETTTIVTSHALEEAEAVSSRLFVVAGGKLPFAGTATELRNEFKCGYVLRVEGEIENVFRMARERVEGVRMAVRGDTIEMPVNEDVPAFIREFEERKEELGVISYSFSVEQLEDVLLKLIQNEEAQFDGNMS
jgi:ABC-type multidrug transport system ATPase subunit